MRLKSFKSGSRNLLTPPVMDTDDDEIWLVTDIDNMVAELEVAGYVRSRDNTYTFTSMINGTHNILLTEELGTFNSAMFASYLTKVYNIRSKMDRVAIFKAVRGEIDWEAGFVVDEIEVTEG